VPDKSLPDQLSLEQYKKQAKDLLHSQAQAAPVALDRIARYHPRLHDETPDAIRTAPFRLADAQLVIAREHGFEGWPKFARHIETLRLTREVASLADPAAAFIEAACVPLHGHASGTLDEAEMILARYPHVAAASIYTAAILADEATCARLPHQRPCRRHCEGRNARVGHAHPFMFLALPQAGPRPVRCVRPHSPGIARCRRER
jgi:hypothetical protein